MKNFLFAAFMLISISVFAMVAHIVTYNTSCGTKVTVSYNDVLTNDQLIAQAVAINRAVCGTTDVTVTIE